MEIKKILKKNKKKLKEFAKYANYTEQGIQQALKKGIKQPLEDCFIMFLCKEQGIDIKELIKGVLKI